MYQIKKVYVDSGYTTNDSVGIGYFKFELKKHLTYLIIHYVILVIY